MRSSSQWIVAAALAVVVGTGCRSAAPATGDGAPQPVPAATPAATPAPAGSRVDTGRPRRAADVEFVRAMLGHHAQALVMTALVPTHSRRDDLKALAQRIDVSQRDEIALMQRWLTARGERVPSVDPAHAHHVDPRQMPMAMPGMLTSAELARLADADGAAFDRLFLQSMIRHHEGALTMVAEYLAQPGAGQDVELFRFASDVDADQRAEIRRMRALLDAMPRP